MQQASKMRLDQALVARGLVASRSRARDIIARGFVRVDGVMHVKPSAMIRPQAQLCLSEDAPGFVSRGGEKLAPALAQFGFDARGRRALDIGASTGGFTEVLLRAGAKPVYAVDVGHGQLAPELKGCPGVVNLEGTDARGLTRARIGGPVHAIVADVSFISLLKVLPAVLALAAPGCWLTALIKPQFEVGRDRVGKGGIVSDAAARAHAVDAVEQWLGARPGWSVIGVIPSPIAGGGGNQEYLIGALFENETAP